MQVARGVYGLLPAGLSREAPGPSSEGAIPGLPVDAYADGMCQDWLFEVNDSGATPVRPSWMLPCHSGGT